MADGDPSRTSPPAPLATSAGHPLARPRRSRSRAVAADQWDKTPLGPRAGWPQPLCTLVDLIRGSAQPMFVAWGPQRTLLYNEGYGAIIGHRHPGAFGRSVLDAWAERADILAPVVERVLAGEPVHSPDVMLMLSNETGTEEEAHYAYSFTPVRGDSGAIDGFFGVCVDTTGRVLAERLRIDGFRQLERLVEQAPSFIAVLEGPEHTFTLANAAFRRLLGTDRELLGKTVREAVPEAVENDFVALLDRTLETGESFQTAGARVRLRRGPGGALEDRVIDFIYQPIRDLDGTITGIFGEGIDVTDRHSAEKDLRRLNETLEQRVADELEARRFSEEALRQSQKMEAIGQLTGGLAHDFNNLLTVIRSSADVLRRLELDEDRRRRYLDAIADTADRAARLTAQLLAFARRQALHPATFSVPECIRSTADMLTTVVGARIDLVLDVECPDCFVKADAIQFETALVNLAVNARDAMDDEGRLTVSVRSVPGISTLKGSFVAICVADSGRGMPPEMIEHIFEPFFTTKDVGKGTGLGLSQVYGFAKQSGGDVTVESTLGEGSRFTLYLPRVDAPEEAAASGGRVAEADAERGHVLIVEDNEQVGVFSTELLVDLGYRSTRAANADAALRLLEDAPPGHYSVVFSDIVMPGMSGVELAQEIRRRWPDLAVVLTTGYSHVLAQEGSHGFELLHKPYSLEDLQRVLRGPG